MEIIRYAFWTVMFLAATLFWTVIFEHQTLRNFGKNATKEIAVIKTLFKSEYSKKEDKGEKLIK